MSLIKIMHSGFPSYDLNSFEGKVSIERISRYLKNLSCISLYNERINKHLSLFFLDHSHIFEFTAYSHRCHGTVEKALLT